MSVLTKAIAVLLAFAIIVALIAALPSTRDYPLPGEFSSSLTLIIGYAFAWVGVFWFISVYWWMMILNYGFELTLWLARQLKQIIGWVIRLYS